MKKRLFAVVMVFSLYVLFAFVFTAADSHGYVSQFFTQVGWSDNSDISTSTIQVASDSETNLSPTIRRPMPKPPRPEPPEPEVL